MTNMKGMKNRPMRRVRGENDHTPRHSVYPQSFRMKVMLYFRTNAAPLSDKGQIENHALSNDNTLYMAPYSFGSVS